jgi:hypothetical protein
LIEWFNMRPSRANKGDVENTDGKVGERYVFKFVALR